MKIRLSKLKNIIQESISLAKVDQLKGISLDPELGFDEKVVELIDALGPAAELGIGSSRDVFEFSNDKVIKIAKNSAGLKQNEAEVAISMDAQVGNLTAKVYEFDENYMWIIAEKVTEYLTSKDFTAKTGYTSEEIRVNLGLPSMYASPTKPNRFMSELLHLVDKYDLLPGDVSKLGSWGHTESGRPVLYDYGATKSIFQRFYTGGFIKKNPPTTSDWKKTKAGFSVKPSIQQKNKLLTPQTDWFKPTKNKKDTLAPSIHDLTTQTMK